MQARFGGRYEIISLIGRGGMGEVFRAVHRGLGKEVALKVLGKLSNDDIARFEREAHAIARLDHPGCVRVYDHGRDAHDVPFLAMELLDGPTLATALAAEYRFTILRAIRITQMLLAALAHAHAQGIIHRDVKPENVMLVRGGTRAVLIDFGLASLRDAPALTGAGVAMGSPSYIAPERVLGAPLDARSDLYSVGVILYEMLAGARPFVGDTPVDIIDHALHRPPRPLAVLRKDVPPRLEALIRKVLAKDPARRFADAEEMLSELADIAVELQRADAPEELEPAASGSTIVHLAMIRPSLWSRIWSWLRYGRWRWRPSS